ncbi:MAG: cation transporter [Phycisphaerales bacterium]|nr:cation transporter [Phycisphaerales bacterium]
MSLSEPERYSRPLRFAIVGLLANALLAGIKLAAGILGNCYALIADAVESFADIGSSVITWTGLSLAARPADENHPYGHGKAEAVAALTVTIMLFIAGAGIAIQAVREIATPHQLPAPFTLWVLVGVIVVKEAMFQLARRVGRASGSAAILADAWHHRSDAITSVAAAIGISIALWAGPGYEAADDWAALFAAGVILVNAAQLIRGPLHELLDADAGEIRDRVRESALGVAGVRGVEKVFARKSGLRIWIDMHLEVDPNIDVRAAHRIAHDVKDHVRRKMPEIADVLVHIEPAGESA